MMTNSEMLICELEILLRDQGEAGLAFYLTNPADIEVTVKYFTPFIGFELSAFANGQVITLVQPAYETGVLPVQHTLAPGETMRIDTPIRLAFDPDVLPSGGDVPTRWTLKHTPTAVDLVVTLRLGGAIVVPGQGRWEPLVHA